MLIVEKAKGPIKRSKPPSFIKKNAKAADNQPNILARINTQPFSQNPCKTREYCYN